MLMVEATGNALTRGIALGFLLDQTLKLKKQLQA
jgi:hypothetical protein